MGGFGFRRRGLEGPNPGGCLHGAGIPDSKPSTAVAYPLSERSYFTSVTDVPKVTDITGGSDKFEGSEVVLVVAEEELACTMVQMRTAWFPLLRGHADCD